MNFQKWQPFLETNLSAKFVYNIENIDNEERVSNKLVPYLENKIILTNNHNLNSCKLKLKGVMHALPTTLISLFVRTEKTNLIPTVFQNLRTYLYFPILKHRPTRRGKIHVRGNIPKFTPELEDEVK